MLRASRLHLELDGPVLGIDVIEQFLARGTKIILDNRIKVFIDMRNRPGLGNLETQVVESGEAVLLMCAGDRLDQRFGTIEKQGSEVEIITKTTLLIVDEWMRFCFFTFCLLIVGVKQAGIGLGG